MPVYIGGVLTFTPMRRNKVLMGAFRGFVILLGVSSWCCSIHTEGRFIVKESIHVLYANVNARMP